jgi:hypothetical protein
VPRHPRWQAEITGDVADLGLDAGALFPAVHPEDAGTPVGGTEQADQDADGRGLAGAVGAEEAVEGALGDGEVDGLDAAPGAVGFGEGLGEDDAQDGAS